mgnify:CR=1 FL=1
MGVVGGHEKRWAILGVMSLSLIIVMFNNVTLNVALPELSKDLSADNTELQWILDAYALIFGGTLLVMGALGDRFGRKPALQLGLLMIAAASAATAMYADATEEANRVEEEVVTAEVVVHHEEVAMEATSLAEGQVVTAGVVVEHPELAEIPVAHVVLGDNSRCRRPPLHLIAFNLRNSRPLRQI